MGLDPSDLAWDPVTAIDWAWSPDTPGKVFAAAAVASAAKTVGP